MKILLIIGFVLSGTAFAAPSPTVLNCHLYDVIYKDKLPDPPESATFEINYNASGAITGGAINSTALRYSSKTGLFSDASQRVYMVFHFSDQSSAIKVFDSPELDMDRADYMCDGKFSESAISTRFIQTISSRANASSSVQAQTGMCYTMAGACFVAWVSGVTEAQCRQMGGGSWAAPNGACVYPLNQ